MRRIDNEKRETRKREGGMERRGKEDELVYQEEEEKEEEGTNGKWSGRGTALGP